MSSSVHADNKTRSNGTDRYLFINGREMYRFKAKYFVIVKTPVYLGMYRFKAKYFVIVKTSVYLGMYRFKAKYFVIVKTPVYLGNISKDFSKNNM